MRKPNWTFIENQPAPTSGEVYLIELNNGEYTLARCTSSFLADDGSPVTRWSLIYYSYNAKDYCPVKRWRRTHEGEIRELITRGLAVIEIDKATARCPPSRSNLLEC